MQISFKIEGADELRRRLEELPQAVSKRVLAKAVRKSGTIILRATKTTARSNIGGKMGGTIARNLKLKAWQKQSRLSYGMGVVIDKGADGQLVHIAKNSRYKSRRTHIPTAIEFGHIAPDGSFVAANPFMRTAVDSTGSEALSVMVDEIDKGTEEAFLAK